MELTIESAAVTGKSTLNNPLGRAAHPLLS